MVKESVRPANTKYQMPSRFLLLMAGTMQVLVSNFCQYLSAAALQMREPRILVSVSYMIRPKLIITEEY